MTSKPAVHAVTAAVSQRIRGSSEPRTAIQAAAGAIPKAKPSTACEKCVNRLVNEYVKTTPSASGARWKHNGFNSHAARKNTRLLISVNPHANRRDSKPAGMCRDFVLGLRASISASTKRLNAI